MVRRRRRLKDGAVRLECAVVQAVLHLQTPAVQGEIFLPSVTAVASAANHRDSVFPMLCLQNQSHTLGKSGTKALSL